MITLVVLSIMLISVYFYGVYVGRKVEREVQEDRCAFEIEEIKSLRTQHDRVVEKYNDLLRDFDTLAQK